MAEQQKTVIVVLEPTTKLVEDLLKAITQKGQAEIERVSSSAEVAQLTAQYQPCMLVACLTENGQVPDRVNLFKRMETSLKKGLVKTMLSSTLKNSQLATVITSLGVSDFIQEPVPLRTLQFKANLQLKAVETIRKAEERKRAGEEKIVFKKSDAAAKGDAAAAGAAAAKVKPALQLREDSFLFKNSGVKKLGKKFVLEMEGPSPETGEWKQHEDKGNAQTSWRWVPKEDENGNPIDDRGDGWVHTGDKPEFKEASGKWQLASETPELAYSQAGKKIAKKVSLDENGEVAVAADSPAAAEALEKNRALAKAKREKVRAKPEPIRTEARKKERAPNESASADDSSEEGEEKKKENPALAMLKRLKQGEKSSIGADSSEEEALSDASPSGESPSEEEESEGSAAIARQKREAKKKPGLSPMEFLQRNKEKKAQSDEDAGEAEAADEEPEENASPLGREARAKKRAKKEEGAAEEAGEGPDDNRSARRSIDALARLKGLIDKEEAPPEEEAESTEEKSLAKPKEEEEESESSGRARLEREEKEASGKASVERSARLKAVKDRDAEAGAAAAEEKKPRTRREVLAEIQERINSPLAEVMEPEEEARLRKKFGLENHPEVKPKDLARKERLDAIKRLKDLLEENAGRPEFEEQAAPEAKVHDLSEENQSTLSQSGAGNAERRESLLRAFDSEDKPLSDDDESSAALKKARRNGADKARDLFADDANYLPVDAITPLGNAWENAGEHYVYLSSDIRYRGFERLEDLLPLWIFQGDKIPELLDKTQQWRFYGPLPTAAKALAEIPRPVRDFLLALRDQVRKDPADPAGREAEKTALAEIEAEETRQEELAAEARAKPATQAAGLEELFEKKNANGGSSAQATLDALKNRLGDSDNPSAEENSASGSGDSTDELSAELGEEAANEKKSSGEAQSRLDALKGRLGRDAEADSSSEEDRAAAEAAQDLGLKEEEKAPPPPAASFTDQAMDKLKTGSPAFEKFLERRKAKLAAEAESESAKPKPAASASGAASANPAYLGIYVALSNSFGAQDHWQKAVGRVLKAIELSFGGCEVALLRQPVEGEDGSYLVDQVSGPGIEAGSRVRLSEGLSAPIVGGEEGGSPGQILGYLYLKAGKGREQFSPAEEGATQKAARLLWPVLKQVADSANKGVAA